MENLKLSYELDRLEDIVEERLRLIDVLKIKPSSQDNVKLKKQLSKTLDILKETAEGNTQFEELEGFSERYDNSLQKIPEGSIEKSLYHFMLPKKNSAASDSTGDTGPSKKVRFKDESLEVSEENINGFEPYHDAPQENIQDRSLEQRLFSTAADGISNPNVISPGISNQDIFVQQQQQLLEQDAQLNVLSESVHRSHDLSLDINQEVTEQNDHVLQDLESLVDYSGRNLDRAKRRLEIFEKSAKENGPCLIIVLLAVILILLLVIL